jgi:hypothetical protein
MRVVPHARLRERWPGPDCPSRLPYLSGQRQYARLMPLERPPLAPRLANPPRLTGLSANACSGVDRRQRNLSWEVGAGGAAEGMPPLSSGRQRGFGADGLNPDSSLRERAGQPSAAAPQQTHRGHGGASGRLGPGRIAVADRVTYWVNRRGTARFVVPKRAMLTRRLWTGREDLDLRPPEPHSRSRCPAPSAHVRSYLVAPLPGGPESTRFRPAPGPVGSVIGTVAGPAATNSALPWRQSLRPTTGGRPTGHLGVVRRRVG